VDELLQTNPRLVLQETLPLAVEKNSIVVDKSSIVVDKKPQLVGGGVSCRTNLGFVFSKSPTTCSEKEN